MAPRPWFLDFNHRQLRYLPVMGVALFHDVLISPAGGVSDWRHSVEKEGSPRPPSSRDPAWLPAAVSSDLFAFDALVGLLSREGRVVSLDDEIRGDTLPGTESRTQVATAERLQNLRTSVPS